ncbi:hypothetical protein TNCV_2505421 [Trichonephila clavipes]|uniref:Uncharacterized protein n=1 Tax=Trichonephila clavipes TaxID=2585209 RepID=A0A8X6WG23_TRICX|nr:hypothetical protein TNCV_2505421 [Trichonephila clavipes]
MIKNVESKTPNNEVLQETNLASRYDNISEKIVKEREDFEGKDSGWTLDEILRLEVRPNRYSPLRELEYDKKRINLIPNTEEKYISSSKNISNDFQLRFLDSFKFLPSSSEKT